MKLEGKKIAIMLERDYQEMEVWYPYYRLKEEGAKIVRVAPKAGENYPSKLGYPCASDAAASDVRAGDFDAVVIPGGWSPDFMRRDENMIRFIQDAAKANLVLAAICHGGWMLCALSRRRGVHPQAL